MTDVEAVPREIQQKIQEWGQSDIVVGVPSFNNAATIGHVLRIVRQGLHEHFPSARSTIINSDGGSKDGTPERVSEIAAEESGALLQMSYHRDPVQEIAVPYLGIPGKGRAVRMIFQAAKMLGAKACAVVDSGIESISPDWVRLLVRPVLEQRFDFLAPYYLRRKFDGTLTNGIVYPLIRALYGRRIRQPMDSEGCYSPVLLDHYLKQDLWGGGASRFAVEIWMTTQAVCGGFRTGQVVLGTKILEEKEPGSDLSGTLTQLLGAVFADMERNVRIWQRVRGSEPVPVLGEHSMMDADPIKIDVGKMMDSFDLGFKNLFEIWSLIMPPATLLELKKLSRRANGDFRFLDDIWVHIIYDFAIAYRLRTMNRDHLLGALTPLYLGWVASFVLQMQTADAAQMESRIEDLCLRYEAEKPYLISRWRWPDRFNP